MAGKARQVRWDLERSGLTTIDGRIDEIHFMDSYCGMFVYIMTVDSIS